MNNRRKEAGVIGIELNLGTMLSRVKEGTAALFGRTALLIDPYLGKQDITKLSAEELARRTELAKKVALNHYGQLAILTTEFHLLGGPAAAKNNPSAAELSLKINLQEQALAEIKVGDQPVVEEEQIFALKSSCKKAVGGLRDASLELVMNTFGIDATVQAILSGEKPDEIVRNAISAQVRANLQEIVRQSGQR